MPARTRPAAPPAPPPAVALAAGAAPRPAARVRAGAPGLVPSLALGLALGLGLTGCSGDTPAGTSAPALSPAGAPSSSGPLSAPTTRVTLPPDPLVALVPEPADLPAGLLPVVAGSGPRGLDDVAGFSADPAAAAAALRRHGFRRAYVAQYAEPGQGGRVLSVVVSQFDTLPGAADDLAGDVAGSGATSPVDLPGAQGARLGTQPLPGGTGTLTTLRFRVGTRTWLLAYGAPEPQPDVVTALGRALAGRAQPV